MNRIDLDDPHITSIKYGVYESSIAHVVLTTKERGYGVGSWGTDFFTLLPPGVEYEDAPLFHFPEEANKVMRIPSMWWTITIAKDEIHFIGIPFSMMEYKDTTPL